MERTGYPRQRTRAGKRAQAVMLACSLLASCSINNTEDTVPLPEGKYPLQLTAEVTQPQTRAGGKNAWTGGEEIGVTMEGMPEPKTYVMDASGKAEPADAENIIYWKSTATARITAWTPHPAKPNVDISDQSGGFAAYDLLYATATGQYGQPVALKFTHRMAKVIIELTAGTGMTAESLENASVTIFGDSEAYFSCGMVGAADQSDGEIKTYHDTASGHTPSYRAVVVPQDMTGKPLIKISTGGHDFVYTPKTEAAGKLEAGKSHMYRITVKQDSIDVQAVTAGTWAFQGEENVTSKEVKQCFKADELKIGDYFYADGTWSDGGLRKRYADGSVAIAEPKPAPEEGKTVIGIVFQTDKGRIGFHESSFFDGNVHGLVMAVKNAATSVCWSHENEDLRFIKNCKTKAECYADIRGFYYYMEITNLSQEQEHYPAFMAVADWNAAGSGHKAPDSATPWYLPSNGQWWDILQNLGCCPALADSIEQTSTDSGDLRWTGQGDVPAALNAWMAKIAASNKDEFQDHDVFWSSSEYSGEEARGWAINSYYDLFCYFYRKLNDTHAVRPVLAF